MYSHRAPPWFASFGRALSEIPSCSTANGTIRMVFPFPYLLLDVMNGIAEARRAVGQQILDLVGRACTRRPAT